MTRAGLAIVGSSVAASLCACAHPQAAPRAQAATAAPDVAPRNVPLHVFDQQTIEHDFPHLPDEVRANHAGQRITVMYFITVGVDGRVTAIEPFNGNATAEARLTVADVDAVVEEDVRHWKFKRQPLPIRSLVRFVFDIVQGHL